MSDRVVIRCPSCQKKLGIKREMLGHQVKCPGCGSMLATRKSAGASTSPSGKDDSERRRRRSRSSPDELTEAPPPSRSNKKRGSKSRRRSVSGEESSNRSRSTSKSSAPRKPAPIDDDIFEEDFVDDDWGAESWDDGGDQEAWADDDGALDLYSDDDDGENWLEDPEEDNWNAPAPLPAAQRKKKKKTKSSESSGKKKKSKDGISGLAAGGGVMVWVPAGLIAGVASFALTIAVGYTGIGILLGLASLGSGALIGGAIRGTSGETEGWGPGLVALAIAIPVIIFGRVGAIYVFPENGFFGAGASSPTTMADVERETSDDGMVAHLIETDLYDDDNWWAANGVNEDNFYSAAYQDADYEDSVVACSERYSDKVWEEGQRRWNALPEETRTDRAAERRLDMLMYAGLMDDVSFAEMLDRETTDDEMVLRVANDVQADEDWQTEAGVTEGAIDAHFERNIGNPDPKARLHPKVLDEATQRWQNMDEEQRAFELSEVENELKQRMEFVNESDEFEGKVRLGAAVVVGFISLFLPIRPLFFTLASMFLAFKIASRMASG